MHVIQVHFVSIFFKGYVSIMYYVFQLNNKYVMHPCNAFMI